MPPSDIHFLTWIEHRRTRELAAKLGLTLVEHVTRDRGLRRYLRLCGRTIGYLLRRRPKVLIVQSPSVVLALLAALLRPFVGYRLLLDAHNEAVEPHLHPSRAMRALSRWLLRRAHGVIVTNAPLADTVTRLGGRPLVLSDPIPQPPATRASPLAGTYNIVLISTFAGDEPFAEVIEAVRRMPTDVKLYVTGNPARLADELRTRLPQQVTLTGFLPEHDYWNLLASCDAVMDLTTMDNCLVCGGYEALALDKPLILSRNEASVRTFGPFGEFCANTPGAIAGAVASLRRREADLRARFGAEKQAFERRWAAEASELLEFCRAPAPSSRSR
jgi:glycosyltransferase involved in cell wall biosynthesis